MRNFEYHLFEDGIFMAKGSLNCINDYLATNFLMEGIRFHEYDFMTKKGPRTRIIQEGESEIEIQVWRRVKPKV
jgi:hypothetical protein